MPKTITLTFNNPNPLPPLGYRVRYRQVGTSSWNQIIAPQSPINIPNLPEGKSWQGTIASLCSENTESDPVVWNVTDLVVSGYPNSGRGFTEDEACTDANVGGGRTFYSPDAVLAVGSKIYTDTELTTLLTGWTRIKIGGANWDMNGLGELTQISAQQC